MQQEYIFILIFSLLLFRALVIVFHEFGHAFAALVNSREKVSVYIGSHGNPEKSLHFQISRLECFVKYNIFQWKGGLCIQHDKNISWKGSILISLFGPLTTFILGVITGVFLLYAQKESVISMVLFAFFFSCILDFLYNIIPRKTQIQLHDGTFTNNDGKQLLHLWSIRKIYTKYKKALHYYNEKEYLNAAELFEECLEKTPNSRELYRLTISSYLLVKQTSKAIDLEESYSKKYKDTFDHFDYTNSGFIEIYKGNYTNALDLFEKALEFDKDQVVCLNNVGHALGVLDRHEEAIEYLDKAILLDENNTYVLDNRGFSKIMLGQLDEGYTDLQKSLELNDQNSYVYRNLGVFHFQKKDFQKALDFYLKALELDPETLKIQEYIKEVKLKLFN